MNMLDLVVIILALLGLATVWHLGNEAKKAALTAAKPTMPWKAWAIRSVGGTLLLLILISHFTGWLPGRREIRDAAANTAAIAEVQKDQKALRPLATNATAILGLKDRVETVDAKADIALEAIGTLNASMTNGFAALREELARLLRSRESSEVTPPAPPRPISSVPPPPSEPPSDSRAYRPTPAFEEPAPLTLPRFTPPSAPIQTLQPGSSLELALLEKRIAALEKAQRATGVAKKQAAPATQKGDGAAISSLAKQVAAMSARQNKTDADLHELSALMRRTLELMGTNPSSSPAATPPPITARPQVPPPFTPAIVAPVPMTWTPANDPTTFVVTRTIGVGPGLTHWFRKSGVVTYVVTGKIKAGADEAAAKNIVTAAIERFHSSDVGQFIGKDTTQEPTHGKMVLALGNALTKVLKGNPGWEDHLKIEPVFRFSPQGSSQSIPITSVATAPNSPPF